MKTTLLAVLWAALPLCVFAQQKSSLDIIIGGDHSYRLIAPADDNPFRPDAVQDQNELEIPNQSWRVGVHYNHRLGKRLYLKTGLQFSTLGYKTREISIADPSEPDPAFGGAEAIQIYYDYFYLQAPLMVRMEASKGKWSPFFETGLMGSFLLGYRQRIVSEIETQTSSDPTLRELFNPVQLTGVASVGMRYQMTNRLQVFIQPVFRFHATPIFVTTIRENQYTAGIELGVRRGF